MDVNQIQESESPHHSTKTSMKEQFTTVTPVSKYLAILLFIALPFVGFWIGFNTLNNEKTENPVAEKINTISEDEPIISKEISKIPQAQNAPIHILDGVILELDPLETLAVVYDLQEVYLLHTTGTDQKKYTLPLITEIVKQDALKGYLKSGQTLSISIAGKRLLSSTKGRYVDLVVEWSHGGMLDDITQARFHVYLDANTEDEYMRVQVYDWEHLILTLNHTKQIVFSCGDIEVGQYPNKIMVGNCDDIAFLENVDITDFSNPNVLTQMKNAQKIYPAFTTKSEIQVFVHGSAENTEDKINEFWIGKDVVDVP